jgi:hypothetical protein
MVLDTAAFKERIKRAFPKQVTLKTENLLLLSVAWNLTQRGTSTGFGLGDEPPAEDEIGHIFAQHPIGPYRADILVDCHFKYRIMSDPLPYLMTGGPLRLVRHLRAKVAVSNCHQRRHPWSRLAIAKHVFQVHGADATGYVLFRERLTRVKLLDFLAVQTRCVVAMEAWRQRV